MYEKSRKNLYYDDILIFTAILYSEPTVISCDSPFTWTKNNYAFFCNDNIVSICSKSYAEVSIFLVTGLWAGALTSIAKHLAASSRIYYSVQCTRTSSSSKRYLLGYFGYCPAGISNLGAWLGSFDPGIIKRPGKLFFIILMIKSQERSIKPFTASEGFLVWLCPIKVNYRCFSVPGNSI